VSGGKMHLVRHPLITRKMNRVWPSCCRRRFQESLQACDLKLNDKNRVV